MWLEYHIYWYSSVYKKEKKRICTYKPNKYTSQINTDFVYSLWIIKTVSNECKHVLWFGIQNSRANRDKIFPSAQYKNADECTETTNNFIFSKLNQVTISINITIKVFMSWNSMYRF